MLYEVITLAYHFTEAGLAKEAINKLIAARLAADVMGVPTIIIARTDADAANLLTSDIDERDHAS